jgi:SSS family solute:Na+ symporter
MLISDILVFILVSLTAFVGMTAKALNPDLDPALAMPWLMMNYVPLWVVANVYSLVLAAAMSSADSLLNASAIIAVNDVIRPFKPDTPDQALVTWTKKATIIIGIFACGLALYAESIIDMFAKAYTMAGGGVVPVLIVGLLWKESRKPFVAGEKNSRLTPWGVRVAVESGALVSLSVGILWGILVATVLAVIVSLMTGNPAAGSGGAKSKSERRGKDKCQDNDRDADRQIWNTCVARITGVRRRLCTSVTGAARSHRTYRLSAY